MGPESTPTQDQQQAEASIVEPDDLLADRYRVVESLASGGFGQVVSALDEREERRVAIKILHEDADERDPAAVARMRQEAEILGAIDHPNIVHLYDVGQSDHGEFMVMELLEGPSVGELLEEEGPASPESVEPVVEQLLSALSAAHERRILHRDIKPSNIVLVDRDGQRQAKLVDFGIAKVEGLLDDDPDEGVTLVKTRGGDFVGTPRFCAPEVAVGDPAGPSADLFSLGLVLAEWLTGTRRIDAERQDVALSVLIRPEPLDVSDCPARWQPWLTRMIAKEPEQRYATAQEALEHFEALVGPRGDDPEATIEEGSAAGVFEVGEADVSESAETNERIPPSADILEPEQPRGFEADPGSVPRPAPPEDEEHDGGLSIVQFVLVAAASCAAILFLWMLARTFLA
ncbi:MAG: serine/threonine-protein kinase [Persicimonas sp.]